MFVVLAHCAHSEGARLIGRVTRISYLLGSRFLIMRMGSIHEGAALLRRRDGFSPFGDDAVALIHGHAGVLREHGGTATPSPRDEIDEMFFAEGCRPSWRVSRHGAAFN